MKAPVRASRIHYAHAWPFHSSDHAHRVPPRGALGLSTAEARQRKEHRRLSPNKRIPRRCPHADPPRSH
ncbi:MAG: hypothetical protein ACK55Z_06855 [bacterium]